jgi:biotin carboxylase
MISGPDEFVRKAVSLPIHITLFQNKERATEYQVKSVDEAHIFEYYNELDMTLALAKYLHDKEPFTAVASFTEFGLEVAARISEELNIPGNPHPLYPVLVTRDKLLMRKIQKEHQLYPVEYASCQSIEDLYSFWDKLQSPFVVKPAKGMGSLGVYCVRTKEEIPKAWEWSSGVELPLIAEEYIEGPEYSVEALTINGQHRVLAITEKITTGEPHFIEIGHQQPAPLFHDQVKQIEEMIIRFLNLIGHSIGPSHTEIRLTAGGPRIIESHTRTGGGNIWEMVEFLTGVDMGTQTLEYLLFGEVRTQREIQCRAAAVRFFFQPDREVSKAFGVEEALKIPGVVRIQIEIAKRNQSLSGHLRDGYVIAQGDTLAEAAARAEQAIRTVKFE